MSPTEQRVAIAEACGWRRQNGEEPTYGGTYIQSGWFDPHGKFHRGFISEKEEGLPDYLNDLNAMHEAEELVLSTPELRGRYISVLDAICGRAWSPFATAKQRGEAILITLNKTP